MNRKNTANRGFSYVEMIIAIAILSIMVGMITITIGAVNRNNVRRTSEKIQSLLNQARVNAMSKGTANGGCVNVAKVDGNYYSYVGGTVTDAQYVKDHGEKLCAGTLTLYFNGNIVNENHVETVQFKQSTGGLKSGSGEFMVKNNKMESSHFSVYSKTGKIYVKSNTSEEE